MHNAHIGPARLASTVAPILLTAILFAPSTPAAPVLSRTPDITGVSASDIGRFTPLETANAFSITAPATVRSVTWRGIFADGVDANPDFPLSFTIYIYQDASGVPGSAVLADAITLTSSTDVYDIGDNVTVGLSSRDIYELQANVDPTLLAADTTYWFSPVANTPSDSDNFYWARGSGSSASNFKLNDGDWSSPFTSDFYFILDDAPIPEPSSLALMALGALLITRRRRG